MNMFKRIAVLVALSSTSVWACYYDYSQAIQACGSQGAGIANISCDFPWQAPGIVIVSCIGGPYPYDQPNCQIGLPQESYKRCPNQPPVASSGSGSGGGNSCKKKGSIIEVDSQTLAEEVDIVGVPYKLFYDSDKVKGRKTWYQSRIYLNDQYSNIDSSTVSYKLDIQVAGQSFTTTIPVMAPGQYYDFTWDGKDNAGNLVTGTQIADVEITVNYNFSTPYPAPTKYKIQLGTNLLKPNIGGWDFSIHHQYDPIRKVLYLGSSDAINTQASIRSNGENWVMSGDKTQIFVFDSNLFHVRTLNALTGTTKYTFTYDSQSRLISIEDAFNNDTTIQYSGANPVSITSPYGQITNLTTDANGYISEILNPASEKHQMTYSSNGLLLTFKKPTGAISTLEYDSSGRLTKDSSSTGSETNLIWSETSSSKTITAETALSRISTHTISKENGANKRVDTSAGVSSTYLENPVTNAISKSETGFTEDVTYKDDPRFGIPFKILDTQNIYMMVGSIILEHIMKLSC